MAYRLKEENPHMILAGERHGKILPGFDTGNSPSELMKLDTEGKTVEYVPVEWHEAFKKIHRK